MESENPTDGEFGPLLEALLPGLRRFIAARAAGVVLAREEADDLAQSVCRDVLERADSGRFELRSRAELKQWLYEAAARKLRGRLRHHLAEGRDPRREVARVDDSDPVRRDGVEPRDSATPSRLVASEEDRARVRATIEGLGGRDAEVLRLAVLEGLSHGDVATRLGVEAAHSRVLLSRALARLARALESR